jgi:hypothetical protein
LDNVSLTGANLRGFNFSYSSLRYANLDNADLRKADLTGADLTGLRVEQTTLVEAVAVERDSGFVIAAYSDGTLREWRPSETDHWTVHTVFSGLEGSVSNLVVATNTLVIAVTSAEAWVLARTNLEWVVSSRTPISPYLRDFSLVDSRVLSSLQIGEVAERCEVDINTGRQEIIADMRVREDDQEYGEREYYATSYDRRYGRRPYNPDIDEALAAITESAARKSCLIRGRWALTDVGHSTADGPRLWNLQTGRRYSLLQEVEASSFDVVRGTSGNFAVYIGTLYGELVRGVGYRHAKRRHVDIDTINLELFGSERHDGPITSLDAVEDGWVITGGRDRCLRIWRQIGTQVQVRRLFLTLRCADAVLDGVEGPAEHELLSRLARADDERLG